MDLGKRIRGMKNQYGTCNPFEICRQEDIPIEYVDINCPLAETVFLHDHPIILLSGELAESRERYFVCAHELAHVELHNGLQDYYAQNSANRAKTECEANKFAAELCKQLYEEEHGERPDCFDCLYHTYGVNHEMMDYL